jgi:hypothetical protein
LSVSLAFFVPLSFSDGPCFALRPNGGSVENPPPLDATWRINKCRLNETSDKQSAVRRQIRLIIPSRSRDSTSGIACFCIRSLSFGAQTYSASVSRFCGENRPTSAAPLPVVDHLTKIPGYTVATVRRWPGSRACGNEDHSCRFLPTVWLQQTVVSSLLIFPSDVVLVGLIVVTSKQEKSIEVALLLSPSPQKAGARRLRVN